MPPAPVLWVDTLESARNAVSGELCLGSLATKTVSTSSFGDKERHSK